jgi:flagellar biosynthesis/type III secretory pathway protein FliH
VLFEEKLKKEREAGFAEGRAEGRAEGVAEGHAEIFLLYKYCKDNGIMDKYEKAIDDLDYRKELLAEMGE